MVCWALASAFTKSAAAPDSGEVATSMDGEVTSYGGCVAQPSGRARASKRTVRPNIELDYTARNYDLAIGMSAQQVVYPGVLRSCFMDHSRLSPASPALGMCTVPLP